MSITRGLRSLLGKRPNDFIHVPVVCVCMYICASIRDASSFFFLFIQRRKGRLVHIALINSDSVITSKGPGLPSSFSLIFAYCFFPLCHATKVLCVIVCVYVCVCALEKRYSNLVRCTYIYLNTREW